MRADPRGEGSTRRRTGGRALQVGLVLRPSALILNRPIDLVRADLRGFVERPGGIGQMRASDRAEVSPSGGDDRIRMIGLRDRADGDRRDADLVAYTIGE